MVADALFAVLALPVVVAIVFNRLGKRVRKAGRAVLGFFGGFVLDGWAAFALENPTALGVSPENMERVRGVFERIADILGDYLPLVRDILGPYWWFLLVLFVIILLVIYAP